MAARLTAADFKSRSQAERLYPADEPDQPYAVGLDKASKAFKKKKGKKKFLSDRERGARSILGGSAKRNGRGPADEEEM
jgi:hypothetical protein